MLKLFKRGVESTFEDMVRIWGALTDINGMDKIIETQLNNTTNYNVQGIHM